MEFHRQKESRRIAFIAVLLAGVCVLGYYCQAILKTQVIFTHFYYIPIFLSALWWKRKGIAVAVFLAGFLLLSNVLWGQTGLLINDFIRSAFFIVIAFVVAMLQEKKVAVKDQSGRVVGVSGIFEDITERKNAEEEKHRMEERSRKVVEDIFRFIPEGVLVFSRKMELLRQNQAFRELVSGYARRLGFAEDELENLIIDKVKAGLRDNNIKEIIIARKHEPGKET